MADVKITALPAAGSVVAGTDVLPLVTGGGATTSKATPAQITTAALNATAVTVGQGGTGATTLTGYVKGTGTAALTASTTIPNTDITGLGTMSTQASTNVSISGGTITGITDLAIADGGTGASTAADARTNLGLNSMATQAANAVAITGGSMDDVAIGATTRDTSAFTTGLFGPAASANFTRFPNTLVVSSNTTAGIQQNESGNIGLLGEGTSGTGTSDTWGVGVYGIGYTTSTTGANARVAGVVGEAWVSAATNTLAAVGVRGYSTATHTGGPNIGLYGSATNATLNYALYMASGGIYSTAAQTWDLNGNLTFQGTGTVSATGSATIVATSAATATTAATATNLGSTGITGLTSATLPLAGTETLMINDGTSNKKTTVAALTTPVLSNVAYGELYVASGVVAQTSNATPETYNKLTCFATVGLSNFTTPSAANDSITFANAGVYLISFFNTFTSGNNKTFRFRLFNETTNTAYANSVVSCTTANTNPTFVAYSAIVSVGAGQVLSVQFTSTGSSETLTITDANISATQQAST